MCGGGRGDGRLRPKGRRCRGVRMSAVVGRDGRFGRQRRRGGGMAVRRAVWRNCGAGKRQRSGRADLIHRDGGEYRARKECDPARVYAARDDPADQHSGDIVVECNRSRDRICGERNDYRAIIDDAGDAVVTRALGVKAHKRGRGRSRRADADDDITGACKGDDERPDAGKQRVAIEAVQPGRASLGGEHVARATDSIITLVGRAPAEGHGARPGRRSRLSSYRCRRCRGSPRLATRSW